MTESQLDDRLEGLSGRLLGLLAEDGPGALAIAVTSLHPADVASVLERLDAEQRDRLFLALDPVSAGEILEELPPEPRDRILAETSDERLLEILNRASADDAIYFLDHLDDDRAKRLLARIDSRIRDQLAEQWELPEDSVGRIMTREVVTLRSFMTAAQAVQAVRTRDRPYEGALYVVDAGARLIGVLPLRILIVAEPGRPVGQIMEREPLQVRLADDRELAGDLMQRYHLRAIPVVDDDGRLCGQVTWDDAVDVVEAEAEEDMLALAGTGEDLDENASVWRRARQRLPYLLLTAVGGFVMARLIHSNTDSVFGSHPILLAFLPLVPALGGNIGIQCSTITVRSIATGELAAGRVLTRTLRELGTGVLLSVVLAAVCGLGAVGMILMSSGEAYLGAVIAVSLLLAIVIAAGFGVFIPLACQRFKIDPAIAAGPFITMLNDITGVGIYIATAVLLLQVA